MVKKWHYLPVKNLSALFRGITSNHDEDFHCLSFLHSYSAKNSLQEHYNVRKNHDFCYAEMANEDNEILKYNHGENSVKVSFIIYAGYAVFA